MTTDHVGCFSAREAWQIKWKSQTFALDPPGFTTFFCNASYCLWISIGPWELQSDALLHEVWLKDRKQVLCKQFKPWQIYMSSHMRAVASFGKHSHYWLCFYPHLWLNSFSTPLRSYTSWAEHKQTSTGIQMQEGGYDPL